MLIVLLAIFSLARGVCSVASKDVLGKTVSKNRRGTVSGYATAAAGVVVVGFGLYTQLVASEPQSRLVLFALLTMAGALWLVAAVVYAQVEEYAGATEGGGNALAAAIANLALLRENKSLRHFLITRTLFLSTALATPFYVVLAQERTQGTLADLGLLIAATGLAAALSAPVWGRMADRSSRQVLVASALVAAVNGFALYAALLTEAPLVESPYFYTALLFVLGVAHSGVRLGRKTYLVDMANSSNRGAYVAVSNTIIGIILLLAGILGAAVEELGPGSVIGLLSVIALVAAASAYVLDEVQ
jgi:predicted MFS family arabinose efflux permease